MSGSIDLGLGRAGLRARAGDLRQLASVRRITLDDGPERGVRALVFSTGGGLEFWVLADRSLDIGPLTWRGLPLAWQGPSGFRAPALADAEGDDGQGFTRSFGGFLVTCGLDHIRQPSGGRPLHGRLPFTPARVLAYGEDWERLVPTLFCEGEVVQARLHGEALRLRRRIEAPIGGTSFTIEDRVTNEAATSWPQALLYHINLGHPFLRAETELCLGDRLLHRMGEPDAAAPSAVACRPATSTVDGEAVATVLTPGVGRLTVAFAAATLPWLQSWHDPRPGVYVLGVEPCTSERLATSRSADEAILAPGASRTYGLRIAMTAV